MLRSKGVRDDDVASVSSEPSATDGQGLGERGSGHAERPASPPDALVADVLEENARLLDQNKRLSTG